MSGNAYTRRYPEIRLVGSYVELNGPHDKYGKIYAVILSDRNSKGIKHMVRGIGSELPQGKHAYVS